MFVCCAEIKRLRGRLVLEPKGAPFATSSGGRARANSLMTIYQDFEVAKNSPDLVSMQRFVTLTEEALHCLIEMNEEDSFFRARSFYGTL